MKKLVLSACIAAMATSGAAAADLYIPTIEGPPVAMDYGHDWSGVYAGVVGGYGWGQVVATSGGTTDTITANGGLLGVTLGANTQFDSFVIGVEGDLAWSSIAGSQACAAAPALACGASVDWMGTVRGRAGVAFDQVLLYGTAGVAFARTTGTVTPAAPGTTGTFSDNFVGWTVGAGLEVAVTDNISLKGEYLYADLGTKTAPAGTLGAAATTVSPTVSTVRFGVNVGF